MSAGYTLAIHMGKHLTQMHNLFLCRREMKPKIYISTNSNTAHTLLQDFTRDKMS